MKQLNALSQKNKQNRVICLILQLQTYWKISASNKFHFYTFASEHKLKLTFSMMVINNTCYIK